ncbi:hypothetical protein [Bradyrhizobium ivorense]|uniref:hypothetical protein n=1 Tax=Bradyrhizobium ivorense TaxID=2511166 RepID=UPI0027E35728|nr:hypothetical protein [Bradyrhizobium ivorense]
MSYSGFFDVEGERFTAVLRTKRHTEGRASIFGVDDLTVRLKGTCSGKFASFVGAAEQVPGVRLEGTLILSEEHPSAPEPLAPPLIFNPDRLPKLPKRFR